MGRKNRQRKPEPFKCCKTCANMQPIGEGLSLIHISEPTRH